MSTRIRTKILAKHAPHILERERRKKPSPATVARAEKIRWIERLAAEHTGDGCRDWPWALTSKGYGTVRWGGRNAKVGHVVLELAGRTRPDGLIMLHSCDRPACVAPWHLRWGTYAENTQDAAERDRLSASKGADNGLAKLTDADVLAIRASGDTLRSLGAQYGVHFTAIQKIRAGKIWRHLLDEGVA